MRGLSNVSPEEAFAFSKVMEPVVLQPPFNMMQQSTVAALRPFCNQHDCGIASYWPLMKGLLAGKMERNHQFDPADRRLTYPIYQGEAWNRSQDLLDVLRKIAAEIEWPVSSLVVQWTFRQPNISSVLCGAKRPEQIRESALAMSAVLTPEILQQIDAAIERCKIAGSE